MSSRSVQTIFFSASGNGSFLESRKLLELCIVEQTQFRPCSFSSSCNGFFQNPENYLRACVFDFLRDDDDNIMENVLDEVVPADDLKKFEQKYHEEMITGKVLIVSLGDLELHVECRRRL